MPYENNDPATRKLLERADALSENDVRSILAYFAGYAPELVDEQMTRIERRHDAQQAR